MGKNSPVSILETTDAFLKPKCCHAKYWLLLILVFFNIQKKIIIILKASLLHSISLHVLKNCTARYCTSISSVFNNTMQLYQDLYSSIWSGIRSHWIINILIRILKLTSDVKWVTKHAAGSERLVKSALVKWALLGGSEVFMRAQQMLGGREPHRSEV